jgi:small subunit ribosomal protein S16
MSVKIRLAKFGKKHAPSYRVVVAHTRTKRNGKFLDILGHINPTDPKSKLVIDKEKLKEWIGKGATKTEAVEQLLEGNYTYVKYEPKKAKGEEKKEEAAPVEEKQEEAETPAPEETTEEA